MNFLNKIENIDKNITEIVCRPEYFDKNCDHPYNKQREEELEILRSKEFIEIIKKFELTNYNNLTKS